MRITVGVTDNAWADFLRARDSLDEVNFWIPSARSFMGRASLGEPFLFKTKAPRPQLVGGGFYAGFYQRQVSEAWAIFGEANGVPNEDRLHASIQIYRNRTGADFDPDPLIGCLVLRNVFFATSGDELPPPENWGRAIVQGKTYDNADRDWAYVAHAFQVLAAQPRIDAMWEAPEVRVDVERYGASFLTRGRLGQGSFRLRVEDAYQRQCAITGSRIRPALQAAHIRPYAKGGEHLLSNGLLLRSDMHTLFDRGYLSIAPDYRLRVSPRLRDEFGNGLDLYAQERAGEVIHLPSARDEWPRQEQLEWHLAEVFKSA